ncbi:MAG: isoaspartyl peptidase/L-asparaginase [Candidatus Promineifilaceae bacterium]
MTTRTGNSQSIQPIIVVHGGAGAWDLKSDRISEGLEACETAASAAQAVLLAGGSALDAVEKAVNILEDAPCLDAGVGSYLNAVGEVEMDALIMDGATLNLGAVAAVQRVRHPISLARLVMDESEHNFFVGSGADLFADLIGFARCQPEDLLVGAEREMYLALKSKPDYETAEIFTEPGAMGDTVGAVALDAYGNLAAATSTGGTRKKRPGRVGDSPLVGSGGYADNWTAAVSATGYGEALMKVLVSKQVCDFVAAGLSAEKACRAALQLLEERVKGVGGLIAIDSRHTVGVAYNTAAMPHAFAVGSGKIQTGR